MPMKQKSLIALLFLMLAADVVYAQNNWYSDLYMLAGSGNVYENTDAKTGGNMGLKEYYNFSKTGLSISAGIGVMYLQDEQPPSYNLYNLSNEEQHSLPGFEVPVGIGYCFHGREISFQINPDFAYVTSFDFTHKFIAFEPGVALLFKATKKTTIGIMLKSILSISNDPDPGFQPNFYGAGIVIRSY